MSNCKCNFNCKCNIQIGGPYYTDCEKCKTKNSVYHLGSFDWQKELCPKCDTLKLTPEELQEILKKVKLD